MSEVLFNGPEGKLQGFYKHVNDSKYIALIMHPKECEENSMNNNIVTAIFDCFYNKNFSTLKFNFRGVEKSQGSSDDGTGELSDAATALDWLQEQNPDANFCCIGGISFGAWVSSQLLMRRPEIIGFVNVSIPTNKHDFSFLSPCPASGLIMQHNKEEDFDIKTVNNLVKNLTNQKNIKIDYKIINSDINFRNKEKQLKNNVNSFILKILEEFK